MTNLEGLEDLQGSIQGLIDQLQQGNLEATQAAGQVIFDEIHLRAKGTVQQALTIQTHKTEDGARSVIQVQDSEPGGKEHHAVFLEYGTSKMAAEPFMRPGFDASAQRASEAYTSVLTGKVRG